MFINTPYGIRRIMVQDKIAPGLQITPDIIMRANKFLPESIAKKWEAEHNNRKTVLPFRTKQSGWVGDTVKAFTAEGSRVAFKNALRKNFGKARNLSSKIPTLLGRTKLSYLNEMDKIARGRALLRRMVIPKSSKPTLNLAEGLDRAATTIFKRNTHSNILKPQLFGQKVNLTFRPQPKPLVLDRGTILTNLGRDVQIGAKKTADAVRNNPWPVAIGGTAFAGALPAGYYWDNNQQ